MSRQSVRGRSMGRRLSDARSLETRQLLQRKVPPTVSAGTPELWTLEGRTSDSFDGRTGPLV